MTPSRPTPFIRGLTWVLSASFLLASIPAPAFAQQAAPRDPRADRIARLQATRPPAAPGVPGAPGASIDPTIEIESSIGADGEEAFTLNIREAPLDVLLDRYSELTGRTMIKAPGIAGTFTFKGHSPLTRAELIQAMDSLLTMQNITLVPLGTRFYRVVKTETAPAEGMVIQRDSPDGGHPESDALVSQLVGLKYIDVEDAMNIVQPMLHGYGKVQRFDRISSLLITETSANLRRIFDILELVDQPTETRVETRVYEIQHAKASDIAARLNELVSDSEKREEVPQVAQTVAPPLRRPPSMIRARQPAPDAPPESPASIEAQMAERGLVQGKVKVLTDERTNIIIVISRPANFVFFDKIVAVLDRPVDPEVIVQVLALEYADAEDIASLLNDFVGVAKSESPTTLPTGGDTPADGRARALEDFVRQRAAAADRVRTAAGDEAASRIGQLSPNTKILADQRTNTLLLMGTKSDIAALEEVVKKVDIMLAQVLIETVILEVNLNNNTAYGVNWLQKSMTAYSQRTAGGVSVREPVASWGGSFGENSLSTAAGDTITRAFGGGSGLNYFFTFADLNIDMVLNMLATSGEGRVLATPVILTTDNTEASIMSGQQIPIRTGDTEYGGTYRASYEYKDVGIQLKVKPRINPNRYVTLDITQAADTIGDSVDVGTSGRMTSINKREMTASISVPSRSTIVLGGLVQTDYLSSQTRIPILGSIPLIGALFRSEDKTRKRTELLVLITPYVLMSPEEARLETERLHGASNVAAEDWYRGWSDSSLAPFSPARLRELERETTRSSRRGARLVTSDPDQETPPPPVALIRPEEPMPRPTPDAMDPENFGREVERMMSGLAEMDANVDDSPADSLEPAEPLPLPAEPTPSAPFSFDPAVPAEPEERPEPQAAPRAPRDNAPRSLWSRRVKVEDPRPSMFAAPPPASDL